MTETERQEALERAKVFFRENIISSHLRNIEKITSLNDFNVNPFLYRYLACSVFGDLSAESIAKTLLYPRILGTSITTTFGNKLQKFCHEVLPAFASTTSGIDIEFFDALDGRKKYCQVKAGPNTINFDDITTIKNHFTSIRNLARQNGLVNLNMGTDCIVGVFYGTNETLSSFYRRINEANPVYVGKDFWHRLTGSELFYQNLIDAIGSVTEEIDARGIISRTLNLLIADINRHQT